MIADLFHGDLEPRNEASGCWYDIFAENFAGRPALFLDRDGVMVEDTHYLGRPQDVRMIAGAADAIARCNRLGILMVLVSNQSGIARRLYDWKGFQAVQAAADCRAGRAREPGSTPSLPARAPRRRPRSVQHCRSSLAQAKPGK